MSIANNIKKLRESYGMSQQQFGNIAGVSDKAVSTWELGNKTPRMGAIERISKYFNIPKSRILDDTITSLDFGGNSLASTWLEKNAIPIGKTTMRPIVGKVCAGNGMLAIENIIGYEPTDERYASDDYFFLQVCGDSMAPKIEHGDLALIKKQSSVDSGSYAVVIIDDEDGLIKRVKYDKDWIELHSINPHYPVRRFEGADVLRVHVAGLVIEIKRKL